jgi:hypothetical protein
MSYNRRDRKLFEALTNFDGELMDAVFTTYNFDSAYFESVLLPKLLDVRSDDEEDARITAVDVMHKLEQKNVFVVADGKVNKTVKKSLYGYHLLPVFEATQHAKIFVLRFEDSFRLILGSANLTQSGIHRNREFYVEMDLNADSEEWDVFFDVLKYLDSMSEALGGKMDTMLRSWRQAALKISEGYKLSGPASTQFVGISPSKGKLDLAGLLSGFFRRFQVDSERDQRVDELYVLSPFFEEDQSAKDHKQTMLYSEYLRLKGDSRFYPNLLLYLPTSGENIITVFPRQSYARIVGEIQDRFVVAKNPDRRDEQEESPRFPHGKLYVVLNFRSYMMTVIGSSNFSPSGFGMRRRGKNNWEANIAFFNPRSEAREVKSLVPKEVKIPTDKWLNEELVPDHLENNPDENSDELIVLKEAVFKGGRLYLTSLDENPGAYLYAVAGASLRPEWSGMSAVIEGSSFKGVSVEVRDKEGQVLQDMPINFEDSTYVPEDLDISRSDLVEWIESRYLRGRHLPLSALLERLKIKRGPRETRILTQVSTEEYLIYRVKTFNHLVSKIYDSLMGSRAFPKRIEYHLTGRFGLLNCVEEYFAEAASDPEREVFYVYQAAEVAASVLGAFEGEVNPDTLCIVRAFWSGFLELSGRFESKSAGKAQLERYLAHLKTFAENILAAKIEEGRVDVAL